MTNINARCLLAAAIVISGVAGAHAQTDGDADRVTTDQRSNTGSGVKTGRGPLAQPTPPATSTMKPQQDSQRPQNMQGPAQTNPPQHPFGTK